MRIDRSRGRPMRYLEWRVGLFSAGAVLAVVGIALEQSWMINVAIGVLVIGVLLRFLLKWRPPARDDGTPEV